MSEWLRSLPHQIPFRSASFAELVDDRTARGSRMITANDALPGHPPGLMLVEAMAQVAGIVVFREGQRGSLAGIERFSIDHFPTPGDVISIEIELEAQLGPLHRFDGRAYLGERLVASGRFYLAGGE